MIVLLDAGPLGLVCNPRPNPASKACKAWLEALLAAGVRVLVPAIADYEVRRELLRARQTASVQRLDVLGEDLGVVPISEAVLKEAAALWALARNMGQPTASNAALDADVILSATAIELKAGSGVSVMIATSNVKHIARFTSASLWEDIPPQS